MTDYRPLKISVLMSVYVHTDESELSDCLRSVTAQSLPPSQVVVVVDGPIQRGVNKVLDSHREQVEYPVEIIKFSENRGLGAALADGLRLCRHELVARVDTDDVNLPSRFQLQQQYLLDNPEVSAVGGLLSEIYENSHGKKYLIRNIPLNWDKILTSSRYRNPINHPTVMFRREDVLKVGGYLPMLWFEDYYLWARLIVNGYSLGNIDQVLVCAHADSSYFNRRGGLPYFKQELALSSEFRKIGFHTFLQSARFIVSRFFFRVIPVQARSRLYLLLLRDRDTRSGRL